MRFRERLFPFSWNAVTIFLLVTVAIIPAGLMWYWVSTNWVPLPFWDEWHTPGSQFESWFRGTLTLKEMFSQHNESRNFFPGSSISPLSTSAAGMCARKFGLCFLAFAHFVFSSWTSCGEPPAQLPSPFWSAGC